MTKLSDFRIEGEPEVESTPSMPLGSVLAFDQTIRHAGWVLVDSTSEGVSVRHRGTLKTEPTGQSGWKSTFPDADLMADQIHGLIGLMHGVNLIAVVHEMPASVGGHRTESSSLPAMAIRIWARALLDVPVAMVSSQSAKNEIFGYVNAGKAKVAAALQAKPWITYPDKPHNEHEYDALALAVTYLIKEGEKTHGRQAR